MKINSTNGIQLSEESKREIIEKLATISENSIEVSQPEYYAGPTIVCPHCGQENEGHEDEFEGRMQGELVEFICDHCHNEFKAEYEVTYTTYKE